MKVMMAFPNLPKTKGYPLLTQNRQFQWFSAPSTFIYPIIPSIAATLLKNEKFKVDFYDGIARDHTYPQFVNRVEKTRPEVIVMETKTPLIKQHWETIDDLKENSPKTIFVLVGDHVTALPKESLQESHVDYVITGGDFDVSLLKLLKHLRDGTELPPGTWYRENGEIKNTGKFELIKNLDDLPFIDRELTKWELYEEAYLLRPVTYTMAGRDCPMRCSFCSWSWNLFPGMRYRSVDNILDEIEFLVKKYKIREIFDDTGTFTIDKKWVGDFCNGMIERGLNEKVFISINARFDNLLDLELCKLMKRAGFRLLKVGLESANDETLKRIGKGLSIKTIEKGYKTAKDAGLEFLLTIMVGYPWENRDDAKRTVELAKKLLTYKTKIGDSLQASIVTPYPGTLLHKQAIQNQWFRVNPTDWEKFDMKEPVLKTQMTSKEVTKFCDSLWRVYLDPVYAIKTLTSIRSLEESKLLFRGVRSVLGHIKDFRK